MSFSCMNLSFTTAQEENDMWNFSTLPSSNSLYDSLPEDERITARLFLDGIDVSDDSMNSDISSILGYSRCFISEVRFRRPYPTGGGKNHTTRRRSFPKYKRNYLWTSKLHGNP